MELSLKNLGIIRDALISHSLGLKSQLNIILKEPDRLPYEEYKFIVDSLKTRISETESLQDMIEILINRQ